MCAAPVCRGTISCCELYRSQRRVGARRRRVRQGHGGFHPPVLRHRRALAARGVRAHPALRCELALEGGCMTDMAVLARTAGGPEVLEWTALDTAAAGSRGGAGGAARDRREFHRHLLPHRLLPVAIDAAHSGRRGGRRDRCGRPWSEGSGGRRSRRVRHAGRRLSHAPRRAGGAAGQASRRDRLRRSPPRSCSRD